MLVEERRITREEATAAPAVVEARNVTKEFGRGEAAVHALRGINLRAEQGEMLAIMGPSGSGKSTLLGVISGLDVATDGQIFINGREITHLSESALADVRNREIGFVFQTFNLVETLSAEENVELPLQLDPRNRFNPRKRAREVLASVGLAHRTRHRPAQLSGGERQRVAVARALVNDPAVIFADEPTGNLDTTNGRAIVELLKQLNRDTGKTFILVTHDPNIAAQCHRTVYMVDGLLATETESKQLDGARPTQAPVAWEAST